MIQIFDPWSYFFLPNQIIISYIYQEVQCKLVEIKLFAKTLSLLKMLCVQRRDTQC